MSKRKTTDEFVEQAKLIHGNKYDYSKVEYIEANKKVIIICPEHGEFLQRPISHLIGYGCSKCGKKTLWDKRGRITTKEWIEKAKKIHGDKYDYSKTEYLGSDDKLCIICPEHGEFWQIPYVHLSGAGCKKCADEFIHKSQISNTNDFVEKSKQIHNNKYDYSKVNYINNHENVIIICPKHGEFYQTPKHHLRGEGCPYCKESKLEKYVCDVLVENNIRYERQKKFEWLGRQSLDFYLPEYNVAIECQGEQHYKPIEFFGGEEKFKHTVYLDKLKFDKTLLNGVKMIYVDDNNKNNFLKNII